MTTVDTQVQESDQEQKQKGKNYPITVNETVYNRTQALRSRLGHRTYSQTVNLLLDSYEQERTPAQDTPVPAQLDTTGVIRAAIDQDEAFQKFQAEEETAQAVKLLAQAMANPESFQSFLVDAIIKEAKFKVGVSQRHAGIDVTKMTTTELTGIKDKRAAMERIRRSIVGIDAYNDQAPSQNDRWFINPRAAQKLSGSRYPIINEYFAAHQTEIDELNAKHKLNDRYNHKPYGIETVVTVSEEA